MVRRGFGLQQRHTIHFAFRIELTNAHFFFIRQAAGHRPGRDKDGRQVAERQRSHRQAGDNFIADAEVERAVKHVVRQANRGGHGNHFAAEQRQLHPVLPLRHAIAHRRNAAGDLAYRVRGVQRFADNVRIALIGLVGGQHIVVGGNNGDVIAQHAFQRGFVIRLAGGKAVGQVTACQLGAMNGVGFGLVNPGEVGFAGIARAFDDAICYP